MGKKKEWESRKPYKESPYGRKEISPREETSENMKLAERLCKKFNLSAFVFKELGASFISCGKFINIRGFYITWKGGSKNFKILSSHFFFFFFFFFLKWETLCWNSPITATLLQLLISRLFFFLLQRKSFIVLGISPSLPCITNRS